MQVSKLQIAIVAITLSVWSIQANGLRVDIAPSLGRTDMFTARWQNWVTASGTTVNTKVGNLDVTFRKAGSSGTGIKSAWSKALLINNTTLTCDGLTVDGTTSGGAMEMVIKGLSSGKHSLVTWHSFWDNVAGSTMEVSVDGNVKHRNLSVPTRVTNDFDARRVHVDFEAQAGKDVVIKFRAEGNGSYDNVVINAFEIDGTDPVLKASDLSPIDGDDHYDMDAGLNWKAAASAQSHDVYFGEDSVSVDNATTSSSEFKGNQTTTKFQLKDLTTFKTYWWRIDERFSGSVVKGDVLPFRIRRLAFPTAMGYGRFARGGRGGRVIEVTNLNDAGAGSLRNALVNEKGPRTIVFKVGGVIPLNSKINIPSDGGDVYIAGQTAPGDGICVTRWSMGPLGSKDVIIRNIRLRVGDHAGQAMDGMGMASADHCIIDHCSISWSIDEAYSSRNAKNITYQRNLVTEALNMSVHFNGNHSFAASISGKYGSFINNLHAHCAGRNWSLAGGLEPDGKTAAGYCEIINNVIYNWVHRTTDGGVRQLNFINNYYRGGPSTTHWRLVKIDGGEQRGYVVGNKMDNASGGIVLKPSEDNWKICNSGTGSIADVRSDTLLFPLSIMPKTAEETYQDVLSNVGAIKPKLDSHDTRILKEVKDRTYTYKGSKSGMKGIIDSQNDVGGYPKYNGGTPPIDSDRDGMPDSWEVKHGLNPNDASDRNNLNLSDEDYTNLEMYLNELAGDPVRFKVTTPLNLHRPASQSNIVEAHVTAKFISLRLASKTFLEVELFDVAGRKIETVYKGIPTHHTLRIPSKKTWAHGVCFLKIKGENGDQVEKITIVR